MSSSLRDALVALLLVSPATAPVVVANPAPLPEDNLARGRTATFSLPPNYPLCTDDGDATDLTDGRRAAEREGSSIWADESTVGWNHVKEPIVIALDLGQVRPIGGAAVSTGFGCSAVSAPRSIAVLVSDDGEKFHLAGDLIRLNENRMPPAYGTYVRYTYSTDSLRSRGRFVRFVVVPSGIYFFSDEIEVLTGDHSIESVELGSAVETAELADRARLTDLGAYARIRTDLETVESLIGTITLDPARHARLTGEITSLKAALDDRETLVEHARFRAIVPFNDLHRRAFAIFGRALQAQGVSPLTIWHSSPYEILDPFVRPGQTLQGLSLDLMLNERRATVFNLTNASEKATTVAFDIEGLPGGTNPGYVRVFEVQCVDTREGKVCGSALLPLDERKGRYQTTVEAGMTRQIWLAFEPRDIEPGRHVGNVRIAADGSIHETRIELNVAPLRFPDRPRLTYSGWDYIVTKGYSITERNQEAARQFLMKDGIVNGVWCNPSHVPLPDEGTFDAEGNLVDPIDFSHWDQYVSFWPNRPRYLAFAAIHPSSRFCGKEIGTPAFDRAMSQWADAWARHNRELGLEPGQVIVLFIDEPGDQDTLEASYLFGKAFGAGTDDILTLTDPTRIDSIHSEWGRKNAEAYDIVCPHRPGFELQDEQTRAAYASLVEDGRELWFYSCNGPVLVSDPAYYRFQPWLAYGYGGTGSAFWALGDASGATSWNEYAPVYFGASYTPLYIGEEDVHTSKHFEAAREGVMDYEYLRMLEDRVAQLEDSPDHRAAAQRAKRLLQTLPELVISDAEDRFGKPPYQGWNNASVFAEKARKRVLAMLAELSRRKCLP